MDEYTFPNTTEGAIQQKIYTWYCNNFPKLRKLLQSTPNEGKRSAAYGNKLKAMGLTPGFPDMAFHFRGTTIFLEIKTAQGSLSPEQFETIAQLEEQGFKVFIIRDLVGFQKALQYAFGSLIWGDLMRATPGGRFFPDDVMSEDWVTDNLTDPEGLGADPWELHGIKSQADLAKLDVGGLRLLASQLLLPSTGTKPELFDRLKEAFAPEPAPEPEPANEVVIKSKKGKNNGKTK